MGTNIGGMKTFPHIALLLCLFLPGCQPANEPVPPASYEEELRNIKDNLAALGTPKTLQEAEFQVVYLYRLASLTGDFNDFKTVENTITHALQAYGRSDTLYFIRANLNFKLHRLKAAISDLETGLSRLDDNPEIQILMADIELQKGKYEDAVYGYEEVIRKNPQWDKLARMAYYQLKTGNPEEAEKLYAKAAEKIPVKDMRSYAWLEVQRGLIDFEYSRFTEALEHYKKADIAYPGYWLVEEHIAEVLYRLGKDSEAIELYEKVIAKTQNPEFVSALAGIMTAQSPTAAATLFTQADELFAEQMSLYYDAAIGHMIEHLLRKEGVDPKLVEYAERNHIMRPTAESKILLAKAYWKAGNEAQAREVLADIIQNTPWHNPDVEALRKLIRR